MHLVIPQARRIIISMKEKVEGRYAFLTLYITQTSHEIRMLGDEALKERWTLQYGGVLHQKRISLLL
jgi:hypothetical protein